MTKIIAIIGRAGSGKDYAGEYLAKKLGYQHLGISSSLKIIARERNIEESRENLIEIGKEVAHEYGDDYLAKVLIENNLGGNLIISGMRQLGQLEYCKNNHKTFFLGVESDPQTRYKRLLGNSKFSGSYEKFLNIEKLDEGNIQNVGKCLELCNEIIENNGTLEEFEEKIDTLVIPLYLAPKGITS